MPKPARGPSRDYAALEILRAQRHDDDRARSRHLRLRNNIRDDRIGRNEVDLDAPIPHLGGIEEPLQRAFNAPSPCRRRHDERACEPDKHRQRDHGWATATQVGAHDQ